MSLSRELQIGKAAEHLVCADLILQGHNAFLSDQGLPYDVVVDLGGVLKRIQVKATAGLTQVKPRERNHAERLYRFQTRRAKGARLRFDVDAVDYFAFVALDARLIAYVPVTQMISRTGAFKILVEFKSPHIEYGGRIYTNGTRRRPYGKFMDQYAALAG